MITLGIIGFVVPAALAALALLPLIYYLVRAIPPAPQRIAFPAVRFLFGLEPREETPARTPWWLLLLRLLLAALVIIGLAHPILHPSSLLEGNGPLLLIVDNGWSAAIDWPARQRAAIAVTEQAERENRPMRLLTTAPLPGGAHPSFGPLQPAAKLRETLLSLAPLPWPADRTASLHTLQNAITKHQLDPPFQTILISDGTDDAAIALLLELAQTAGPALISRAQAASLPMLLLPPVSDAAALTIAVMRAVPGTIDEIFIRALHQDGRLLARQSARFQRNATKAEARFDVPLELRNQIARLEIEGQQQIGGVVLLDTAFQRKPIGILSLNGQQPAESLLNDHYYLERALPLAEIRRGTIADFTAAPPSLILWPDSVALDEAQRQALEQYITNGGIAVRFAGEHLAIESDTLVPTPLRPGGRTLGSALQWGEPARLAPFDLTSPFAGLAIPNDVTISRQLLAEPSLDLADKVWARLADGTPLVTATKQGKGYLVLFHVPPTPDWSQLPLSGLFVDMLARLIAVAQGQSATDFTAPAAPQATLDGFARLGVPDPTVAALLPSSPIFIDASHPPGLYGNEASRHALNLTQSIKMVAPLGAVPPGIVERDLSRAKERDLKPLLLEIGFALLIVDQIVALVLRGGLRFRLRRWRPIAAGSLFVVCVGLSCSFAAAPNSADQFALKAANDIHLAYVMTGNGETDATSRAGLKGLTTILNGRTAMTALEPIAVDVAEDELAFFPLLYWPIVPNAAALKPDIAKKISFYVHNGGTILFDTQTEGSGLAMMPDLLKSLALPQLMAVPTDHVLTKTFYLLRDFPGRYVGGALWVETNEHPDDEVSPIIVGTNDYAAAWALDDNGRPLYAMVPGGEQQREIAYRVGINLVMYALTGNYKSDQVHVPTILERLGQ